MAAIRLDDVTVRRGGRVVLDRVSLAVADGESVAVLGSSGGGKTTLLRAIAGLDDLDGGTIRFDGHDVRDLPTRDRDLAMVFQDAWLQPHLSIRGNLEFPLRLHGIPRRERLRRIAAELRAFALQPFANRRPGTLSSGERHAAATAQSMVRAPTLLLMDEPVARVDAPARREVLRQVDQVRAGYGCTMLVATNDREVAATLGQRTAVLEQGRIVQCAPFQVLWTEPATLGVADLVGEWPLGRLPARVRSNPGERVRLDTGLGVLRTWRRDLPGDTSLLVGIRPEDLVVTTPSHASLRARVAAVRSTGARAVVDLRDGGTGSDAVLTALVDAPGPRPGDLVGLAVRRFHVFDRAHRALAHVHLPGATS